MTVIYRDPSVGGLLFRWNGSIWKSVWKELLLFLSLYCSISITYRYGLVPEQKKKMDLVVQNFNNYLKYIPITFLLGFYVTSMVNRWWQQFQNLVWPDDMCAMVNLILPGEDAETRTKRRVLARYLILTCVLAWREVSVRIRKRFPTADHIVQAGLMTKEECKQYQAIKVSSAKWMLPLDWIQRHVEQMVANKELAPPLAGSFMNGLNSMRSKFRQVFSYDWVAVPLIYTQVAALATYSYFLFCLIGRQYLDPKHKVKGFELDLYVPIFTTLQFLFYVGWFKVGQDIMRPFGEDEDDFELNYILDRHVRVAFAMVDTVRRLKTPDLVDTYAGHDMITLPHTVASSRVKEKAPKLKTGKVPKKGRGAEMYKFVSHEDHNGPDASAAADREKRGKAAFNEAVKKFGASINKPKMVEAVAEKLLEEDDVSVHSLAV